MANYGYTGEHAFPELGSLAQEGTEIDAYWADNACIDEHSIVSDQTKADKIKEVRRSSGWRGLYFGGTAFKCQRHVKGIFYRIMYHYIHAERLFHDIKRLID